MKNKRKARILALQVMYAYDVRESDDLASIFETIVENSRIGSEVKEYAQKLVFKLAEECSEIDTLLQRHTANWDVRRMAVIDRNILRLAITELDFVKDVPFKVVIDEAVEIAKIYGTDESGKFVNGVIDAIYKEISKE